MGQENIDNVLITRLKAYKKKYYVNQLIRGSIFFFGSLITIYLLITTLDFGFKPGIVGRSVFFFSFISAFAFLFFKWVWTPASRIYMTSNQISDEEAASQIGELFPTLKDKLLNTIQLYKNIKGGNTLVAASIEKRTNELSLFTFTQGIKFSGNKRYVKFVAYPAAILILLLLFIPQFITESTVRIINYDEEFAPPVLFTIQAVSEDLTAFKNENYKLDVKVEGSIVPDKVYLNSKGRRIKMIPTEDQTFSYTFEKVQSDFEFNLEAVDYQTKSYRLNVYSRPDLKNFNVQLKYPNYIKRNDEVLENTGNLNVPEGTKGTWILRTIKSESANIIFGSKGQPIPLKLTDNQLYTHSKRLLKSEEYTISLKNEYSANKDKIQYHIDIIKDKHPTITLNAYQDTTLFSYMVLGGEISDDYGVSNLELMYKKVKGDKNDELLSRQIPIKRGIQNQNYFYQWILDSLNLDEGDKLEYYLRVWDNDGVNGSKFTTSATYQFQIPTIKEIKENVDKQAEGAKDHLDKSLEESKELTKQIEDLQNELKTKKKLDWQEKKQFNELIKQKEK